MDATKEILKEGGKFTLFLQLHYVIYLLYGNKNSVEWDWVYTILETLFRRTNKPRSCENNEFSIHILVSNIAYIMFSSS